MPLLLSGRVVAVHGELDEVVPPGVGSLGGRRRRTRPPCTSTARRRAAQY